MIPRLSASYTQKRFLSLNSDYFSGATIGSKSLVCSDFIFKVSHSLHTKDSKKKQQADLKHFSNEISIGFSPKYKEISNLVHHDPLIPSRILINFQDSTVQKFGDAKEDLKNVLENSIESITPICSSIDEALISDKISPLQESFYKKPIEELKNKIHNVYKEHENKNWDGYGAEPIKYLSASLKFADYLFSRSRTLIESVDIVPENDGCLCFEWFKSDSQFINISVENDNLIYTYKFGDEKACGEVNFSAKHTLIEKIKKMI